MTRAHAHPGSHWAVLFCLMPLALNACAPEKTDVAVVNVTATEAPLGSVRKLPLTAVPLPPGDWVELARRSVAPRVINENLTTGTDRIELVFGLIENNLITQYLYVNTNNSTQPGLNWILGNFCTVLTERENKSVFLQKVDSTEVNRSRCLKVTYATAGAPRADSVFADAWNAAKQYGGLPRDAIEVGFEATANGNVMDYRLFRFPSRDGQPAGRWVAGALDPARQKYLQSLVGWAEGFQHWIIDGTKNAL